MKHNSQLDDLEKQLYLMWFCLSFYLGGRWSARGTDQRDLSQNHCSYVQKVNGAHSRPLTLSPTRALALRPFALLRFECLFKSSILSVSLSLSSSIINYRKLPNFTLFNRQCNACAVNAFWSFRWRQSTERCVLHLPMDGKIPSKLHVSYPIEQCVCVRRSKCYIFIIY